MDRPERPDDDATSQDATIDEESRNLVPRILIAPIAILIAVTMIGLPVLRILTADEDTTVRRQAASDARGQVAVIFSSAVLESRSTTIASRYAVPDIQEQVAGAVVDLQRMEPADLQGAVASTVRTSCENAAEDQECFVGRLARSGEDPVAEIAFIVGIVDGSARVVAIIDRGTVLLGGDSRSS